MIPQTANAIRERIRYIALENQNMTDKELYWEYLRQYHKICSNCVHELVKDDVPSMDTVLRRLREVKESLRKNIKLPNLI